jgi:hypothetical protein
LSHENRAKVRLKVSTIQRKDFAVKLASCIVQSNHVIAYVDLRIQNLVKNHTSQNCSSCGRCGYVLALEKISENPYQSKFDSYSSPSFEALAIQLELLVDKYALIAENISLFYLYALIGEQDLFTAALTENKS